MEKTKRKPKVNQDQQTVEAQEGRVFAAAYLACGCLNGFVDQTSKDIAKHKATDNFQAPSKEKKTLEVGLNLWEFTVVFSWSLMVFSGVSSGWWLCSGRSWFVSSFVCTLFGLAKFPHSSPSRLNVCRA